MGSIRNKENDGDWINDLRDAATRDALSIYNNSIKLPFLEPLLKPIQERTYENREYIYEPRLIFWGNNVALGHFILKITSGKLTPNPEKCVFVKIKLIEKTKLQNFALIHLLLYLSTFSNDQELYAAIDDLNKKLMNSIEYVRNKFTILVKKMRGENCV